MIISGNVRNHDRNINYRISSSDNRDLAAIKVAYVTYLPGWVPAFRRPSILILGPEGVGKTSLFEYLSGRPIPEDWVRTRGQEPGGRIVYSITGGQGLHLRAYAPADVAGESPHVWRNLIKSKNPDAIIYVLDTSNARVEEERFHYILESYQSDIPTNKSRLRFILVAIVKADTWGNTEKLRSQALDSYRGNILKSDFDEFKAYLGNNLEIQVVAGSLKFPELQGSIETGLRILAQRLG